MPVRLATPMLSVDPAKMHKVDTRNVENLFGMWTGECCRSCHLGHPTKSRPLVFSRCADSMEDGRRLENLSWRIWNRETLCCESQPQLTTTPAIDFSRPRPRSKDVPELSTSVDSVTSDSAFEATVTAPVEIRSNPSREYHHTQGRSRGREKHITSLGLEKMVYAIKEKQDLKALHQSITEVVPASVPTIDVIPQPTSPKINLDSSESSNSSTSSKASDSSSSSNPLSCRRSDVSVADMAGSDTSIERLSLHNVVRGFSPYNISSSYRSHTHLAPSPIPTKAITHIKIDESKSGKTTGMFQIGGSSGEDDSSFDEQMCTRQSSLRQSSLRQSSLTAALKRPPNPRNKTSFQDELHLRTMNNKPLDDEDVFESTDDEDMEGSVIEEEEDDEGSDWEDSVTDNGETLSNDQNLFKRVDSKPNLVSRRSLLTTQLNESDRKFAFAAQATKAAPHLQRSRTMILRGPSTGTSPEDEENAALAMRGSKMTRSKPIIMTTTNTHPPTLSPRTTRRNMLATELTESLRKHLLWERQQKNTTATAVLKRRHTAADVTNLQDYPGAKKGPDSKDTSKNNSWNHFFIHGLGEYHQTGW